MTTKTAHRNRNTSHRRSSGTRRQELDTNSICTKENYSLQGTLRDQQHFRCPKHHNQANDDILTRRQRPSNSSIPRSDFEPSTILLQDMEETWTNTKNGAEGSQRSTLYQLCPHPKTSTQTTTQEYCYYQENHQQSHIPRNMVAFPG